MSNPMTGINYLLRGFGILLKPGIRPYVIIPLLINTGIFVILIGLGVQQFSQLIDWLMPDLPEWLQWLSWLMWLVFALSAALILFFSFSLLCNIFGAPFNGPLALAVERYLSGSVETGTDSGSFIANAIPSIVNELKKVLYFLLLAIPFLILFIIPVINVAAPFIWFVFSAWILSLEYIDYPSGNHDVLFNQQKTLLRQSIMKTMGFGSAVGIATLTPIANFMVMPAAVAGATIYWCESLKEKHKSAAQVKQT
jgi:CysZ protein